MNIFSEIRDKERFFDLIISEISKLPFGSVPKKEIEAIILHALISSIESNENDPYSKIGKHIPKLMLGLKNSQTQLKNKILECQLRYNQYSNEQIEEFIYNQFLEEKFFVENSTIHLTISNPLVLELTKNYFENKSLLNDISFSRTTLKLNTTAFIRFILESHVLNENKKSQITTYLITQIKDNNDDITSKNLLHYLSNGLSFTANLTSIISFILKL
jgi:hypothetical protein